MQPEEGTRVSDDVTGLIPPNGQGLYDRRAMDDFLRGAPEPAAPEWAAAAAPADEEPETAELQLAAILDKIAAAEDTQDMEEAYPVQTETPAAAAELGGELEETAGKTCRICEIAPGAVLAVLGAGALYIGIDLITRGRLTALLAARSGRAAAEQEGSDD